MYKSILIVDYALLIQYFFGTNVCVMHRRAFITFSFLQWRNFWNFRLQVLIRNQTPVDVKYNSDGLVSCHLKEQHTRVPVEYQY